MSALPRTRGRLPSEIFDLPVVVWKAKLLRRGTVACSSRNA